MTAVSAILLDLAAQESEGPDLPHRLCQHAVEHLDSFDGASLTLAHDDHALDLVATSDERIRRLARRQLDLGEGPSLEAHRSGSVVSVDDLSGATARWPVYAAHAAEAGVGSGLAIPLRVGAIRLGVLGLVTERVGSVTDSDRISALDYADAAVLLVLHLHSAARDDGTAPGPLSPLEQAFDGRAEVHQATGMVSVQMGVGLTDALLMIRARAFSENRSMMEVAQDVVGRTVRFS